MRSVEAVHLALIGQVLQLGFEVGQRVWVDQLPEFVGAKELGQHAPVEGERLRPALGERCIALVHEVGDVVEGERAGERRGNRSVDPDDAHDPRANRFHQPDQAREIEDVAQALPVRLEQDRELAVARRDGQQVGRPLALLPQRRATTRPAARKQQGAGRVFPEAGGEQRRGGHLRDDQLLDLLGVERRTTIPSSLQMHCTSTSRRSRIRASMAIAQGAWTRAPKGDKTQTRQSPSSSRNRSTTTWRSVGNRPPVDADSSSR